MAGYAAGTARMVGASRDVFAAARVAPARRPAGSAWKASELIWRRQNSRPQGRRNRGRRRLFRPPWLAGEQYRSSAKRHEAAGKAKPPTSAPAHSGALPAAAKATRDKGGHTRPADPLTIGQLRRDPENRRRHSERNLTIIADALRTVGAARSIVIDGPSRVRRRQRRDRGRAGRRPNETPHHRDRGRRDHRRAPPQPDCRAEARHGDLRQPHGRARGVELRTTGGRPGRGLALLPFFTADEQQKFPTDEPKPAPDDFKAIDGTIEHTCPKCGYEWSGKG